MIENPTDEQLKTLKMIIYLFTNKINGKQYVGQTIGTFKGRYYKNWYKYAEYYLKNALLQYGQENFHISILEHGVENVDKLNKLETYYIKQLNTFRPNGYNLDEGGKNHKRHEETKQKLSIAKSKKEYVLEDKNGNIIRFKNLKKFIKELGLKPDSAWNFHALLKGKQRTAYGYSLPGTDRRIRSSQQKISYVKDKNGNIYEITNIRNFAKEHNIQETHLGQVILGRGLSAKGFSLLEPGTNLQKTNIIRQINKY